MVMTMTKPKRLCNEEQILAAIEEGRFLEMLHTWEIAEIDELISEIDRSQKISRIMEVEPRKIIGAIQRLGSTDAIVHDLSIV